MTILPSPTVIVLAVLLYTHPAATIGPGTLAAFFVTEAPYLARLNCAAADVPFAKMTLKVAAGSDATSTVLAAAAGFQSTRLPCTRLALMASAEAAGTGPVDRVLMPACVRTATLTVWLPDAATATVGAA